MHDMNHVLKAYNVSKRYRCLVNYLCCCCCGEERKRLQQRLFYDQWIDVRKASEPDEIKWENLGVSSKSRCFRRFLVWLLAAIILLAATIGMVQFKVYGDK